MKYRVVIPHPKTGKPWIKAREIWLRDARDKAREVAAEYHCAAEIYERKGYGDRLIDTIPAPPVRVVDGGMTVVAGLT